jgi:hypothetical protein
MPPSMPLAVTSLTGNSGENVANNGSNGGNYGGNNDDGNENNLIGGENDNQNKNNNNTNYTGINNQQNNDINDNNRNDNNIDPIDNFNLRRILKSNSETFSDFNGNLCENYGNDRKQNLTTEMMMSLSGSENTDNRIYTKNQSYYSPQSNSKSDDFSSSLNLNMKESVVSNLNLNYDSGQFLSTNNENNSQQKNTNLNILNNTNLIKNNEKKNLLKNFGAMSSGSTLSELNTKGSKIKNKTKSREWRTGLRKESFFTSQNDRFMESSL